MSVPYADEKWITVTPGAPLQGGKTIKITFRQGKLNEDLAHLHFLLQESGLREKTGKKVTEKLMKTRSIYLKDPSSTESPAIILGDGSWYDELHDTEEYTFTLQQRVVNPFINDDDRACCGLDFIHHIEKIESFFSFLDITEDEDKATEVYIEQSKYLLAGGKVPRGSNDEGDVTRMPRLLPKDSEEYKKANKETARVIPFEDEMATGQVCMRHLLLPETDDWYEVEHRNFMKTRIRIEMKDTAKYCVFLFYLSILEFCFGWVILGVGTLQLNGGSEAILIASFTCGAIMALSSVLGFLGSLSAHEAFIQRFMVSALLTMSFLTTVCFVFFSFVCRNVGYACKTNNARRNTQQPTNQPTNQPNKQTNTPQYLYVEISFLHEKTLEFGTNDLAPATAGSVNAQHVCCFPSFFCDDK